MNNKVLQFYWAKINSIYTIGFMYLRYTQPPSDLFEWYEPYLLDEEEIDVKAGGGQVDQII